MEIFLKVIFNHYDSYLNTWLSVDPLAHKSPHQSPYVYTANNPIRYIDPDGRSIDNFIFNEKGNYVRTEKNNDPHRLVVENSQTGFRQSYKFADPISDPKAITNGTINKLEFVDITKTIEMVANAGAFSSVNRENKWNYIKTESVDGGMLDFSYASIPKFFPEASYDPFHNPSSVMFIPLGDGYAYNHMNFGNFLWGAAGHSLGFNNAILGIGAHYNSLFNSHKNDYLAQFDSTDDQLSIIRGANYAKSNVYRYSTR